MFRYQVTSITISYEGAVATAHTPRIRPGVTTAPAGPTGEGTGSGGVWQRRGGSRSAEVLWPADTVLYPELNSRSWLV